MNLSDSLFVRYFRFPGVSLRSAPGRKMNPCGFGDSNLAGSLPGALRIHLCIAGRLKPMTLRIR